MPEIWSPYTPYIALRYGVIWKWYDENMNSYDQSNPTIWKGPLLKDWVMTCHWSRWRRVEHPSVIPLSLKVNEMVLQIEGIVPRKLLINKFSTLYFLHHCGAKLSSTVWYGRGVTEVGIEHKFWRGLWHHESNSLQSRPKELALQQEASNEKGVLLLSS